MLDQARQLSAIILESISSLYHQVISDPHLGAELVLGIVSGLITWVITSVTFWIISKSAQREYERRRTIERRETEKPFRDVLISKLVAAQTALLSALSSVSFEGNWRRPKIRSLANAVGEIEMNFSDALMVYRNSLEPPEWEAFGVYAKILTKIKTAIDEIDPNALNRTSIQALQRLVAETDEVLTNLKRIMPFYAERIGLCIWTREQRQDLGDALWGPLNTRADTNSQRASTQAAE